jgi:hypothetical protein
MVYSCIPLAPKRVFVTLPRHKNKFQIINDAIKHVLPEGAIFELCFKPKSQDDDSDDDSSLSDCGTEEKWIEKAIKNAADNLGNPDFYLIFLDGMTSVKHVHTDSLPRYNDNSCVDNFATLAHEIEERIKFGRACRAVAHFRTIKCGKKTIA